jgi:UDP-galactopyranose mutase
MIYTGPIDEYFESCYGALPYRSLRFEHETHDREWFQPAPVINFPNEQAYTRVTEFKYLTGQTHPKTSVVYEYPTADGAPYYPIPCPENAERYRQYKALADKESNTFFVGRLATYKYYNMDQVVAQALTLYNRLMGTGHGLAHAVTAATTSATTSATASATGRPAVHAETWTGTEPRPGAGHVT